MTLKTKRPIETMNGIIPVGTIVEFKYSREEDKRFIIWEGETYVLSYEMELSLYFEKIN